MENRETKTIETKHGAKVEIKTYLTAKEGNALKEFAAKKLTISAKEGETINTFNAEGSYVLEFEKKEMEAVFVSVNGKTDKIFDELESLRLEEYVQVLEAVQLITMDVFPQVKK